MKLKDEAPPAPKAAGALFRIKPMGGQQPDNEHRRGCATSAPEQGRGTLQS
jgi:hypothetical protein